MPVAVEVPTLADFLPKNHVLLGEDRKLSRGVSFVKIAGGHVLLQEWRFVRERGFWIRSSHDVELYRDEAKLLRKLLTPKPRKRKVST
jgi:hypothetical protein